MNRPWPTIPLQHLTKRAKGEARGLAATDPGCVVICKPNYSGYEVRAIPQRFRTDPGIYAYRWHQVELPGGAS